MLAGIDIVQISRMVEVVEKSDERLERLFHLGKLPTAAAREGARRRLSPDITRLKRLFLKHWGRASAREPGEMWKYAMISGGRLFLSFTGIMQVRRRTGRPGRRRCQFLMTEIMLWLK